MTAQRTISCDKLSEVRAAYRAVYGKRAPFTGDVEVVVIARFAAPGWWPHWRRRAAEFFGFSLPHEARGKVGVGVMNALTGSAWDEHADVACEVRAEYGRPPRCLVTVWKP